MVEVMKIMVTSLKRSHVCTATLCASEPEAGHQRRPPLTHTSAGDSWTLMGLSGSVSCGVSYFSFILDPGAHKVLFVPSKFLFPQSCVSSGGSMVGFYDGVLWWG